MHSEADHETENMTKLPLILALLLAFSAPSEASLSNQMLSLDKQMFDFFNNCTDSSQLQKYEEMHADDIEFYHDNGGVTWNRKDMLSNVKNNVCGNFYRELVPASFKAFPINGFGAITQGTHVFCSFETKKCEGKAEFTMVWRLENGKWQVTRALSYGHRAN
jgi:hypothetical protein